MSGIEVRLNPDVSPNGSDLACANAARRSFNTRSGWDWSCVKGCIGTNIPCTEECHNVNRIAGNYKLKNKDKRLLEFLARGMTVEDFGDFKDSLVNNYQDIDLEEKALVDLLWKWRNTPTHDTPFNHCHISFEVKAPIFVARQLVKHEYLVFSEFSRRYITDDVEFYEPDYWRRAAENKKQGSSSEAVTHIDQGCGYTECCPPNGIWMVPIKEVMEGNNFQSLDTYKQLLDSGVAPEQARMVLPQSTMTEWTHSGTLGAFAKMCRERLHPDAQYESRIVAGAIYDYLKEYYPVSSRALVEGVI